MCNGNCGICPFVENCIAKAEREKRVEVIFVNTLNEQIIRKYE